MQKDLILQLKPFTGGDICKLIPNTQQLSYLHILVITTRYYSPHRFKAGIFPVMFQPDSAVIKVIITKTIELFNKLFFMNMYVSNLSFSISDDKLKQLFEKFGVVSSAKVITDRETGRSRGFGFVEMSNETEANAAMSALNNTEVDGRAMSVSVAREKQPRNDNRSRW